MFFKENASAATMLSAGIMFSIFMNLDLFSKFKGIGIEAELRQTVNDAHATLDELKDLASVVISNVTHNLRSANRIGGMTTYERCSQSSELREIAKRLNILELDNIKKANEKFDDYMKRDILNLFSSVPPKVNLPKNLREKLYELSVNYSSDSLRTPDEVENFLASLEDNHPMLNQIAALYRNFSEGKPIKEIKDVE